MLGAAPILFVIGLQCLQLLFSGFQLLVPCLLIAYDFLLAFFFVTERKMLGCWIASGEGPGLGLPVVGGGVGRLGYTCGWRHEGGRQTPRGQS